MPARAPRTLRRWGRAALAALAAAVAGCGSATVAALPPAAAPRDAPPLTTAPAGRVVALRTTPRELLLRGADVLVQGDGYVRLRARDGRVLDCDASPRGIAPADEIAVGDGTRFAVVSPRERVVELFDRRTGARLARADAGVGPTRGISNDRWLWIADTQGNALLVFRTRPELELVRRVFLPGGPYAIALDATKLRLWVTLTGTNEIAELPANGRPRELRRFPTVRQPDAVAVDSATHRVFVGGRRELQLLDPGPLPPRN